MATKQVIKPAAPAQSFVMIDPKTIVMRKQVREERNEKADAEFFASVARDGAIYTPVLARMVKGKPELIAGHRRTEAAIAAGFPLIPVYLRDVADGEVLRVQMIENIQREGLSLLDTARGVRGIHEAGGSVVTKTAEALGKSNGWVSKMLIVSGEDKANPGTATIAQKLMAADKLGDLESAYALTKLQERNPVAAQEVADNIDNETRGSILKRLQRTKPLPAEKAPAEPDGDENEPTYRWMLKIIEAATVSRKDAPLQQAAIALLREWLGEEEEPANM